MTTFYRIPDDGAPMRCTVCGKSDRAPKIKVSGIWGAMHVNCIDGLQHLEEISAPKER